MKQHTILHAPRGASQSNGLRAARALYSAGDHVELRSERGASYEIVHIFDQKAWVRPVESGSQQIVSMNDLGLVTPCSGSGFLRN